MKCILDTKTGKITKFKDETGRRLVRTKPERFKFVPKRDYKVWASK